MGLLDDAIREHLELKRRHGASREELERQEQEALGPARQGEFARPASEPAPAEEVPSADAEAEPEAEASPVAPPPVPVEEPAPEPEPAWLDEPDEVPAEDALEHHQAAPAEEPAAAAPGGDDVLEETPDFLQETPEHDRLWFEQKPPRDFDFDK